MLRQRFRPALVMLVPNVNVDLRILNSAALDNLESFNIMEIAFSYTVTDKIGKKINGTISAVSKEDAQKMLEASGYAVESIQEASVGRTNPFASY
jgi:hypothetical protein